MRIIIAILAVLSFSARCAAEYSEVPDSPSIGKHPKAGVPFDLDHLKSVYSQALSFPDVKGLVIGTRPDCINDEQLKYFQELAENYYVIIEYGAILEPIILLIRLFF